MKKHHTTVVLAILFFTGLIVLWWADYTGVDPDVSGAVLPELSKVQVADIRRVEVIRPKEGKGAPERLVFERRDEGGWQMVHPIDAAASPTKVETLARNLKDLRKSADAGTIHDPPGPFGLATPSATFRLYGSDAKTPIASLDVGREASDQLYVRPGGGKGIEVIEPRLLHGMTSMKPEDWRDRSLFHLPSFRVGSVTITGPGRDVKAEREQGHWRIVRPYRAVGDDEKVEGTVAELTALRVAKKEAGFVANDVKGKEADKYGLDSPFLTIELKPGFGGGKPQTLHVGGPAPGQSDMHYARSGDQDDVVLIDAKGIRDLGLDPNALRSKKVADLDPALVEFVRVEAFGRTIELSRSSDGWMQVRPDREGADTAAVQQLLNGLAEASTTEFLDPAKAPQAGIDPPWMTIKVWQAAPRTKLLFGLDAPPKADPRVVLQVGKYDPMRKTVYARLEGDKSLLTLPETFRPTIPKGPMEYRDRSVLTLSPGQVLRLTLNRGGTTSDLVAPATPGKSTHWQMVAPVEAPADEEAVTNALVLLMNLRAESFITDQIGDGKSYGLDHPTLTVTWTIPAGSTADRTKDKAKDKAQEGDKGVPATETGTLCIGAKLPKGELWYANLAGSPVVFTLPLASLQAFEGEFHTHQVMTFAPEAVRRLVLRWPGQSHAFKPQLGPSGSGPRWVPEGSPETQGVDLSRLVTLVGALSNLSTPRFLQYLGPIEAGTGLNEPGMTIEVSVGEEREPQVLRLGKSTPDTTVATTASGSSGPVFVLSGPAWNDLVQHVPGSAELPEEVFVPEPAKPAQGVPGGGRP